MLFPLSVWSTIILCTSDVNKNIKTKTAFQRVHDITNDFFFDAKLTQIIHVKSFKKSKPVLTKYTFVLSKKKKVPVTSQMSTRPTEITKTEYF